MKPFTKLKHIDQRRGWIVGHEDGTISFVSDEFLEDTEESVLSSFLSKSIKVISVNRMIRHFDIPKDAMAQDRVTVEIKTYTNGELSIRAGFSLELKCWVVVNDPDDSGIIEI